MEMEIRQTGAIRKIRLTHEIEATLESAAELVVVEDGLPTATH